ncbi:glycosyltransferase family 4 protein [Candidatus Microgenomates bacterium]|nr:glycosyltransferase family 4 protein [Candidatus Microgenomates bacterium]
MRAAIYDPYLDTLGGGERYVMTVAQVLIENGWNVDVEWGEDEIKNKLENRLGIDLSKVKIVKNINKGQGYDLVFWLSDGSVPNLSAKKNILHFQVPFHYVNGKSLFNRLKLRKINSVVCNSNFTKQFIDREYGVNSVVIYPPVDVASFKPLKKENIILSVGRFSQLLQAKRQDVLVDTFKKMIDGGLKGWKLILAGGSDVGGKEIVENLREESAGYNIEIKENPDFNQLKNIYGKAKIFWSASGFEINEEKNPQKVEHFGITVVEAMSAGCVPIVFAAGGHREIVNGTNGYLWEDIDQLIDDTNKVIRNDKNRVILSEKALEDSNKYGYERFKEDFLQII